MYKEGYYRGKKKKRRFGKDVDKPEPLHTDGRGCKPVHDKTLHDSTCMKVLRAVREKQSGPMVVRGWGNGRGGNGNGELVLDSTLIQRRQWHPTPVLLPGKSHGWRSLVGCGPWGR